MGWLKEQSLNMVYGPRGIGKSMALLGLSLSLTTGRVFLKWPVTQTVGVLYVDGEMSLDDLRSRAKTLAGRDVPACLTFLPSELVYTRSGRDLTLTCDAHSAPLWNLLILFSLFFRSICPIKEMANKFNALCEWVRDVRCEQNRREIEAMFEARPALRILVLDNVPCLFPGISEDKKQDWEPINGWLIRLRHRGITVIFGHHAGKGGQQRGTSGREDALDTVIALSLPPDHQAKDGCHFHLHFKKSRRMKGPTVEALDVRLDETPDGLGWTWCPLETSRTDQVKILLAEGIPPKVIAEELAVHLSYVYRLKKQLGV
jgi:putative DNA primase/helicase